jgi:hypothetical protein
MLFRGRPARRRGGGARAGGGGAIYAVASCMAAGIMQYHEQREGEL